VFTVHLAPEQVVAALSLEFHDHLTTPEIEKTIASLERAIHAAYPEVIAIFVKPEATAQQLSLPGRFGARARRLSARPGPNR
jgi:divalent metal cation (Fe/Co/Zn/Cd) transporter